PAFPDRRGRTERLVDVRDVDGRRHGIALEQRAHRAVALLFAQSGSEDDRLDAGTARAADEAVASAHDRVEIGGSRKVPERAVPELEEVLARDAAGIAVAHRDVPSAARVAAVHEDARNEAGDEHAEVRSIAEPRALDQHAV